MSVVEQSQNGDECIESAIEAAEMHSVSVEQVRRFMAALRERLPSRANFLAPADNH